jgi:hypothetical protein
MKPDLSSQSLHGPKAIGLTETANASPQMTYETPKTTSRLRPELMSVQHNSNGPIIDESHFHVSSKSTGLHD